MVGKDFQKNYVFVAKGLKNKKDLFQGNNNNNYIQADDDDDDDDDSDTKIH